MTPTIVIVESGLKWLAAIRTCWRRSRSQEVRPDWVHVLTSADVSAALVNAPAALVIMEVAAEDAARDILQLDQWREAFPAACFVAALDRRCAEAGRTELVLALWEAGAVHVFTSPQRVAELLPLVVRHARIVKTNEERRSCLAGEWPLATADLPACWTPAAQSAEGLPCDADEQPGLRMDP